MRILEWESGPVVQLTTSHGDHDDSCSHVCKCLERLHRYSYTQRDHCYYCLTYSSLTQSCMQKKIICLKTESFQVRKLHMMGRLDSTSSAFSIIFLKEHKFKLNSTYCQCSLGKCLRSLSNAKQVPSFWSAWRFKEENSFSYSSGSKWTSCIEIR